MAFEHPVMCQVETRKILWLLVIVFTLLLLAEHFEVPYGYVMASLLSSAKTGFRSQSKNNVDRLAAMRSKGESTQPNDDTSSILKGSGRGADPPTFALPLSNSSPQSTTLTINDTKSRVHKPTVLDKNAGSSGTSNKIPRPLQNGLPLPGNSCSVTNIPAVKDIWKRPMAEVVSISEMHDMLLRNRASSLSVKSQCSSAGDQELLNAKSQIENAPVHRDYPGLDPQVYRNISLFKRSYELMEQMLKVYIYREGKKPVFHQPRLTGIYASEGWFMKLLEASKQYVTNNPREAHLFYLPFNSKMLEKTFYVRRSHSFDNLIEYLKDYLDLIKGRYPFWNRTSGADHFLVACHDWAPAETRRDLASCIRALCNSDLKEGFQLGKDVSLPGTKVDSAQHPSRQIGGKPPSERHTLAFFAGKMHGYVRPILLKHWENKDPDMQIFGRMRKSNYMEHMNSSKYCICPRGYEVSSPRVVEAIICGCVPVIISDNYVPPFFEVLNWESFAVFVLEKDIPNLKRILLSISERRYLEMQNRVKRVRQHFLWHVKPEKYDIFHMILHSIWYNRVFQMNA